MARHSNQNGQKRCDDHFPFKKYGSQRVQLPLFHENYPNCTPQSPQDEHPPLAHFADGLCDQDKSRRSPRPRRPPRCAAPPPPPGTEGPQEVLSGM